MPVDVPTEIEIERPRAEVAAYVSDPDNATAYYANIEAVEWQTAAGWGRVNVSPPAFSAAARRTPVEIRELVPGERSPMLAARGHSRS